VPRADDFNRIEGNIETLGRYDRAPGYGTATGTNAKTITLNPAPTSYYDGLCFAFKNATQNTGAVTINVNGLGARPIKKPNGNDIAAGNLKANSVYTVRYNGTNFILQGEGGEYGNVTPGDVIKGVTFGTEEGLKTGTLELTGELTGNAATADVLSGKTFYSTNPKSKLTGTMPNHGSKTFTPNDTTQTSGAGYYSGITVNPRPTLSGNATASQVLTGRTFYSNTYSIATGTMPNRGAVTNTITTQGGQYTIPSGYHNGSGKVTASFSNLSAGNVKNGVNIGGIVGTLKPAPTLSHTNIIASRILRDPNNDYIGLMIEKPSSFTMNVGDSYTNSSFLFIQYYTGVVHSDARFTISVTSGTIYVMSVYSTTSTRVTVTPSTPYTTPHSQFAILNPERVTTRIRFSEGTYSKDVYRGVLIS
jgi:hypothetical protein